MKLGKVVNYLVAICTISVALRSLFAVSHLSSLFTVSFLPFLAVEIVQIVLLLTSREPKYSSSSWEEYVIPILTAMVPISLSAFYQIRSGHIMVQVFQLGVTMSVWSEIFIIIALMQIKSSFSILPEARVLVTKGLYRYIRHPIYVFYMIWYVGSSLEVQQGLYAVFMLILILFQIMRAKLEDRKLSLLGEESIQYQKKTGMFFPKIRLQL